MSTKDWLEKDYYKILGVSKNAKADEIKKAFRKIARENHPDQHPGDTKAEQRFKEASEAHSVLSDPDQRKEYDEARSLFGGGGFRMPSGGNPGSFSTIFSGGGADADLGDLLGGLFGGAGPRRTTTRSPRRGRDIEAEAQISFLDSVEGITVSMQLPSESACQTCQGTGAKPGTTPKVCQTCQGSGMTTSTQGGVFAVSEPCRDCHGRGLVVEDPCPDCHGSGRSQNARPLSVRIPAGVSDGQRIRVKGKGVAGERGGPAGDLYVTVRVGEHPLFSRKGDALTVEVPITIAEAVLGGEVSVPTIDGGSLRMRVPELTSNGRVMRLKGKGVAKKDGSHGDLLVTLVVTVPSHLSAEARQAMEAFAAATADEDPRAGMKA